MAVNTFNIPENVAPASVIFDTVGQIIKDDRIAKKTRKDEQNQENQKAVLNESGRRIAGGDFTRADLEQGVNAWVEAGGKAEDFISQLRVHYQLGAQKKSPTAVWDAQSEIPSVVGAAQNEVSPLRREIGDFYEQPAGGGKWEVKTLGNRMFRVNAATGQFELLADSPKSGTAAADDGQPEVLKQIENAMRVGMFSNELTEEQAQQMAGMYISAGGKPEDLKAALNPSYQYLVQRQQAAGQKWQNDQRAMLDSAVAAQDGKASPMLSDKNNQMAAFLERPLPITEARKRWGGFFGETPLSLAEGADDANMGVVMKSFGDDNKAFKEMFAGDDGEGLAKTKIRMSHIEQMRDYLRPYLALNDKEKDASRTELLSRLNFLTTDMKKSGMSQNVDTKLVEALGEQYGNFGQRLVDKIQGFISGTVPADQIAGLMDTLTSYQKGLSGVTRDLVNSNGLAQHILVNNPSYIDENGVQQRMDKKTAAVIAKRVIAGYHGLSEINGDKGGGPFSAADPTAAAGDDLKTAFPLMTRGAPAATATKPPVLLNVVSGPQAAIANDTLSKFKATDSNIGEFKMIEQIDGKGYYVYHLREIDADGKTIRDVLVGTKNGTVRDVDGNLLYQLK